FANTPDVPATKTKSKAGRRSTVRVKHHLSLRASRRRLLVRVHLARTTRVRVVVRRAHGGSVAARTTHRLGRGRHTLRVRLGPRVRPGAYDVTVTFDGKTAKRQPLRVG